MDYLQAFTIGSSGLVIFPFLSNISNDDRYEHKKKLSLILPFYYGIMSMIVIYIKKNTKLSLELCFFIVFVLSTLFIYIINRYYNDKYDKTASILDANLLKRADKWRQLVTFIILYFLTIQFSKNEIVKLFIIGSSIFSYYINFYYTSGGDQTRLNYQYKYFSPVEPLGQGILLVLSVLIGTKVFKLDLLTSLILFRALLLPIGGAALATYFLGWTKSMFGIEMKGAYDQINVYNYSFERYATQLFLAGTVKAVVFYYLLTRLK